jgi:hypothetical protein
MRTMVERGLSDEQVAECVEELLEAARTGELIEPARGGSVGKPAAVRRSALRSA